VSLHKAGRSADATEASKPNQDPNLEKPVINIGKLVSTGAVD